MRGWILLLAAVAWLAAVVAPASAATVIFYSKLDNTYGWCAGYSYSRGEACARDACSKEGGKACEVALECDGGWGAAAFAADPHLGFGASCSWNSPTVARLAAIWACIEANRVFCWTSSTFTTNGREQSPRDNEDFDLAWYAQTLLREAGYDAGPGDGEMGSRTRAAVRKFEADIGREPTGKIDYELVDRMIDALEGTDKLVEEVSTEMQAVSDVFSKYTYAYAAAPQPATPYTARLLGYSDDRRRASIATVMTLAGTKCTIPAQKVKLLDKDGWAWNVTCDEGPYSLLMAYGNTVVTEGYATYHDMMEDGADGDAADGGDAPAAK